jgi:hypothetical protein
MKFASMNVIWKKKMEWKFQNKIWNIVEGTIEGNEKVTIQTNFQKLHAQRKTWKGHNWNSICWVYYSVNDDKDVKRGNFQVMKCLLCYTNPVHVFNIRNKKGLIGESMKKQPIVPRLKSFPRTTFSTSQLSINLYYIFHIFKKN